MNGFVRTVVAGLVALSCTPAIAGTHDCNGDGHDDITWRHISTGADVQWRSGLPSQLVALTAVRDLHWKIVGTGDFDGDGRGDLLWRNVADGRNVIWRGGNAATMQAVTAVRDLQWRVVGVGDFDGDHRADLLWAHPTRGHVIWYSAKASTLRGMPAVNLVGIADVTGDGRVDIVGRTSDFQAFTIRFFAWPNAEPLHEIELGVVSAFSGIGNYQMEAVGDFDGNGRDDLFWRDLVGGRNMYWPGGRPATPRVLVWVRDLSWIVVGAGDFDGDGKSDLVWRHRQRGDASVWPDADGNRARLAHVSASWSVAP